MQFNFDIEYKKGKENNVAHSLSRLPMGKVSAVHVNTTGEALHKFSCKRDALLHKLTKTM